ncbi:hypothetical protein BamMEX5DRAFT_4665 [Burkholderia ambifaria MEX-5]|uniref:Uncharacterized protein n=1 Tax=Burkholderia ambifaria MEX-5 TaxID=396597 RepID=B1TA49_9BURK|nr:hypothetical protein BamMEX5DRAFT_4665 [Burkholderia ambifaria MEX-5]
MPSGVAGRFGAVVSAAAAGAESVSGVLMPVLH